MGKVKKEEAKPKKEVSKGCCKSLEERLAQIEKDVDIIGNWIENVDNDLVETDKQLKRIAVRLGLLHE